MFSCFGTGIVALLLNWRHSNPSNSQTSIKYASEISQTQSSESSTPPKKRVVVSETNNALENINFKNPLSLIPSKILPQEKSVKNSATNNLKVIVDLSDRRVYVRNKNQVIASYPAGIGKKGWETPIGSFKVIQKIPNPSWKHPITGKVFPAGKDSPLGKRWVGFWSDGRNYIGFHGTPDNDKVGTAVSHGCLRMRNDDVVMLYQQVSMGTPVEVQQ